MTPIRLNRVPRAKTIRKALLPLSRIYRDRSEFDLVLADCQKANDIDPQKDARRFRRVGAYAMRGNIFAQNLQQYDKAIVEYSKVLRPRGHIVVQHRHGTQYQQ